MISYLPISMDGSCNGYQHLSAMGRDPNGGRATNLMALEARARQGEASSNVDAASNGPNAELARQLLAIMDRKLAKTATMTTPYGVTPTRSTRHYAKRARSWL